MTRETASGSYLDTFSIWTPGHPHPSFSVTYFVAVTILHALSMMDFGYTPTLFNRSSGTYAPRSPFHGLRMSDTKFPVNSGERREVTWLGGMPYFAVYSLAALMPTSVAWEIERASPLALAQLLTVISLPLGLVASISSAVAAPRCPRAWA
jgi:hypothetical protein